MTVTGIKLYADYEIRDMTIRSVSARLKLRCDVLKQTGNPTYTVACFH